MKPAYCVAILTSAALLVGCDFTLYDRDSEWKPPSPPAVSPTPPVATPGAVVRPETRPTWVDEPSGLHGGDFVTKVLVGPEADRAACEAKLPRLVEGIVADYVAREYGPDAPARFDLMYATLTSRVVAATWEETVTTGDEPGTFLHVQLRFDDKLRAEWKHAVDRRTTAERTRNLLGGLTVGMAAVLVVHLMLRFGGRRKGEA